MASNAGTVFVTVKIDDDLRQRLVVLLEKSRQEHYADGHEGIMACDAIQSWHGPCDCGADELNAEIDTMVAELKALEAS